MPLTRCHLPAKHPTAARQQSQPTTAATVAQRNRCLLSIFYGNPIYNPTDHCHLHSPLRHPPKRNRQRW